MPFLLKNPKMNLGIILCVVLISCNVLAQALTPSHYPFNLIVMNIIISMFFLLLFWWRRKITQSYIEKLRMDELESLYHNLSEKEKELQKLHTNNTYLAKIIHKDNKLIPAMELAVYSYLQNASSMPSSEAREYGRNLLSQLQDMSAGREGILKTYQEFGLPHTQVGIHTVDAVIQYMEKRAISLDIKYNLKTDSNLKERMLNFITEADVLHLLSDLLENAIIATTQEPQKEILLHMGFLHDNMFIDLYDSGIPFSFETYQNFGINQHTTHSATGGSGIGLMDIWMLKRKYKASLQIYEYPAASGPYTKKIRVLFDAKKHFLIRTYRATELKSRITRKDLYIFPDDTK